MNLKESLNQFVAPVYGKTRRSVETYKTVAQHCSTHIDRLVGEYHMVKNDQQWLRELHIRNGGNLNLPYHGEGAKMGIEASNVAPGLFPEEN